MVTFGRVPKPEIFETFVDTPENSNWDDRGPRNIVAVCVHRMDGTMAGTDPMFHDASRPALADFGIGNGEVDGEDLDGVIYQWNQLDGNRSPYANGWDSAESWSDAGVAEGHGLVFMQEYYPEFDVNRDIASIENSGHSGLSGTPETPVTDAQFESLASLIAYICDKYCEIPWNEFPYNKKIGDDFYAVYQHFEFASKECPFPALRAEHENYVARAKEIMEQYQEDGNNPDPEPDTFEVDDKIKSESDDLSIYSTPGSDGPGDNGGTMTPEDKIIAASRGSAATARAYADQVGAARLDEVYAYIDEVYRLAPTLDFDAAIIIAQSVHETGDWQASWWTERLNPAGIGITGDPAQNDLSKYFEDGVEAARAQLAHMHAYVYGDSKSLPSELEGTDPRYDAVFDAGTDGSVETIADLAEKWAVDADYATGICNRGNAIFDLQEDSSAAAANEPIGTLTAGTEVCVLEGPEKRGDLYWYRVSSSPEGWVAGESLVLVQADGCGGSGPDPEPEPSVYSNGDRINVTQGPKSIKTRAGEGFETIYELSASSVMCVLQGHQVVSGVHWYEIRTTGGSVHGWVSQDRTSRTSQGGCTTQPPRTTFAPGDRISVVGTSTDARSGPGSAFELVASLNRGTQMCVLSDPTPNSNEVWYQIRTTDRRTVGWINGDAVQVEVVNGCPGVLPPTEPGPYQINDRIQVVEGPLNVRSGAGASFQIVTSLEAGTSLCVLSGVTTANGLKWQRVRTTAGSVEGWIVTRYTKLMTAGGCVTNPPQTGHLVGDRIRVSDGPLNVRTTPSLSAPIVTSLAVNSQMCVLNEPVSANGFTWYHIRTTGGSVSGWVAGQFTALLSSGACLTSPPPFSPGDRVKVKTTTLQVRSGAAASSDLVYTLAQDSWLCVLSQRISSGGQSWYEVRTTGGSVHGWVLASGLTLANVGGCVAPVRTAYQVGDRISVTDGPLNVRSSPGTIYTVLGSLNEGTHVCVLGGPTSDGEFVWYQIRVRGGTLQGWIAGEFTQIEVVGGCA